MRKPIQINSGSMADIAFLLLIFFLVATTIDQDKGIKRKLPPDIESTNVQMAGRNVLFVLLNANDEILVNYEPVPLAGLRSVCKGFLDNHGERKDWSVNPSIAVVSIKSSEGSSYDAYIGIQNEVAAAYRELRDAASQKLYGVDFAELKEESAIKAVKAAYPMRVSETEPVS